MDAIGRISDPYNVIVTGVGGQGNVMASRVLGNMMVEKGLSVTIGETFGASQRGGSVMSHLRISRRSGWSPQIPKGRAHVVVALEPIEAIRVLADYGNPKTRVICNNRPIHPVGVIAGDAAYPSSEEIRNFLGQLASRVWFIDATDAAVRVLDQPILGNILMIGALAGIGDLPMDRKTFETVMARTLADDKMAVNLLAYDMGRAMVD